mmetsp:Transcript_43986/g.59653  ORF Transcript_43986/g.59653 Transcript_43986/m.59653 type:complete len:117 (+) Transcript_43986:1008-1358(+)
MRAIKFTDALCMPGVMASSLCYFGLKFSYYGIMYWLPLFLAEVKGYSDYEISGSVAYFEFGTLSGSVIIGLLSDLMDGKRMPLTTLSILIGAVINVILSYCTENTPDQALGAIIFF